MTIDQAAVVLAAIPLLITLINLTVFRTPRPASGRVAVSVLIPARNEANNVAQTVRLVLASVDVDVDLVVLDDNSTDGTAAALAPIADPRLRVVAGPPLPAGWCGKQHACAVLATLARHNFFVFIDADVHLAPDALTRVAGFMQRSGVGLGSGFPNELTGSLGEKLLLPLIHFLLLGFLPMPLMRLLRAPGLGAGCGQLFVATRDAYERVGGHSAIRRSLHDGLQLPRAFRRAGIMTGLFDASRFASCRMYSSWPEVWQGLMKNATEAMAKPVALPVWTVLLAVGQVLPLPLLLLDGTRAAAAALLIGYGTRLILVWRFGGSIVGALLHPLGVAVLLALQWTALLRARAGRPALWRGRAYSQ